MAHNNAAAKGSKKRPSKAADEEYESDGGFVANDDDDTAPRSKKVKTTNVKVPARQKNSKGGEEEFWEISDNRRLTIDKFKGNTMVGIREFYKDKASGKMLPAKKGISLPLSQYSTLITLLPNIEAALAAKGEKVPRPDYSTVASTVVNEAEEEEDEHDSGVIGEGEKEGKQNFEATSEEEE